MPKESKLKDLLEDLDINETHTKTPKKPKVFTKVRDKIGRASCRERV